MTVRRDPRLFDKTRGLVMARFATLYEHDMNAGDPLTIVAERGDGKGEVELDMAIRLWLSGQAVYASDATATPQETPEQAAERLVVMEPMPGGYYLIRAPWLGEGEKIRGKDAANQRRAEIVAKGDTKGVTVTGGDGGWYEVKAPWIDEAEKVQGKDAAEARSDQLIAEGPPEGWVQLTDEEKAAIAKQKEEQAAALQAAREEADRVAKEGRKADEAAIAAAKEREAEALKARATELGFTDEEWAAVAEADRAQALSDREAANAAKAAEEKAAPVDAAAFTATAGPGGWFTISGPGITDDAPVKVQGQAAADAKVAELAKAYTDAHPATELQPRELAEGEVLQDAGDPSGVNGERIEAVDPTAGADATATVTTEQPATDQAAPADPAPDTGAA